jgi:hypothetical protein
MLKRSIPSVDYDFGFLRAAIPILENYLLSKDLYWSLADSSPRGEPAYPQLTIGNLLSFHARLKARNLTLDQQAELTRLENQLWVFVSKWRLAWEKKAGREFGARLKLWRDFLEEYRTDPENHADRYAYEVGRRVLLTLLQDQTSDIPAAERELLAGLDRLLEAIFVPGDFVWDDELASGFPQTLYWYLYGRVGDR